MLKTTGNNGRKLREEEHVRIRVKSDRGLSVMKISGSLHPMNTDVLARAVAHFENPGKIKYYVDFSKTAFLCEEAIDIITGSLSRITGRGDIFDIIDMSLEAEISLRAANAVSRPSHISSCAYSACM